jgi:hypothetical protein
MPAEMIPVLIVFIVIGVPVICGTLIKLAKIMRGDPVDEPKSRRHGREVKMDTAEETRLIQEIHRGLGRLESRLDALETIVLQGEPKPSATRHDPSL